MRRGYVRNIRRVYAIEANCINASVPQFGQVRAPVIALNSNLRWCTPHLATPDSKFRVIEPVSTYTSNPSMLSHPSLAAIVFSFASLLITYIVFD